MTLEDLENLVLAVTRYRIQLWANDPKISDLECWLYTSALMYGITRAVKVQINIIQNPEAWGTEARDPEAVKSSLESSLGIKFGGPIPEVETFWPYAISKGVIERMTEQNYK